MLTYAHVFRYGLFAAEGTLKVDGDWKVSALKLLVYEALSY